MGRIREIWSYRNTKVIRWFLLDQRSAFLDLIQHCSHLFFLLCVLNHLNSFPCVEFSLVDQELEIEIKSKEIEKAERKQFKVSERESKINSLEVYQAPDNVDIEQIGSRCFSQKRVTLIQFCIWVFTWYFMICPEPSYTL